MSWWQYVVKTAGTESPKALNKATGIDGPNFSKWKGGQTPGPAIVKTFALAYRRPVLEAFVAAGFLTPEEARQRPVARPDFTELSNDELVELVRARLREEGETGGNTAPTKKRRSLTARDREGTIQQAGALHRQITGKRSTGKQTGAQGADEAEGTGP